MKAVTLEGITAGALQKRIRSWLANHTNIEIQHISQSQDCYGSIVVTILYKENE